MKFSYSFGQRPLDGYTLKRGVGKGGFGEVYYGVSDGGKEVALKLVRGNLDIELRGVAQCLNLKHQNLVNLYDLRKDSRGDHWVVMEYVAGEPLSIVLNRHQQGVAPELARQWFLELAKAVGYLHDHGIVHRDLKPGNIFLEAGTIKIGDYGLSKFISGSAHAAQTQSVGTVHYMAPEIGSGNYSKQIDIYAAGIILYEMLSGHVPFDGESAAEILMKHLTQQPDLDTVAEEFQPILERALAKDPAERYATMAEMARAVEMTGGHEANAATVVPVQPARPIARADSIPEVLPAPSPNLIGELCGSMALAAVLALLGSVLWSAVSRANDPSEIGTPFFLTTAISWAILVPSKFWSSRRGDSWARRLTLLSFGVGLGFATLWFNGWTPRQAPITTQEETEDSSQPFLLPTGQELSEATAAVSYFAVALFVLRWWKMTERRRSQRFSFAPVVAVGCWAYVLLLIWHNWQSALSLVLAAVIVQLVSPWEPAPKASAKRLRLRYV